ncbi:MAG TPA: hypothetical protein VJN90_12950 [Candidatus Acidoferrales bacterium]|nr:hypothetical protein [Candidatus Acidoferrales bacterium]
MSKRIGTVIFFVTLLIGIVSPSARAQVTTGKTVTVKPKTVKPAKVKLDIFKGEVIRMNTVSIIVRDPKNSYIVRTFTFSPDVAKKLQPLIDKGGYQSGDRVTIKYAEGSTVAQSITGKASKAF